MKQGRHYLLIFAMLLCSTTGHCDEIITFADDLVRLICVTQWDTNTDGDLSKDEAAVVTSLGTVFKETAIVSFDELQYFTGLSSIATNAFQMCTSLESIVIPANVTQIGNGAFKDCTSLESVLLPDSLTSIGSSAFEECIGLKAIYEYSPVPVQLVTGIHTRAESVVSQFAEVDMETCVLYIPVGSKTAYMQAEGWKEFKNIVEMDETCDITIGKNGKTTFCGDKALDFSYKSSFAAPYDLDFTSLNDDVKAFTATGYDASTKTIWLNSRRSPCQSSSAASAATMKPRASRTITVKQ